MQGEEVPTKRAGSTQGRTDEVLQHKDRKTSQISDAGEYKPWKQPPPIKKSHRFKWLLYIALWAALTGAFGFIAIAQASQYSVLQSDLTRIREETQRAIHEHERLQRQLHFIGTDAYIEEQARQRLNLVLPTELIFINIGQ